MEIPSLADMQDTLANVQESLQNASTEVKVGASMLAVMVTGASYYMYKVRSWSNWFNHYEKQGFTTYPGSRSGLLGVIKVYQEYAVIRASDVCVENGYVWMMKDHWQDMAKLGLVPMYPKGIAMNFVGQNMLILTDPKHMEFFTSKKEFADKESSADRMFPKRLHDNLLSIKASPE